MDLLTPDGSGSDTPSPDSVPPDGSATDHSGSNAAVPDILTDIGGLPSAVPDPADAPTLSHIGRYALKHQIGSGGLGAVFEAWDPLLSRAVAVKTMQFDVEQSEKLSLDGLFLNEARAAASLNHRYIVTIHDAGLSAHGVYIAMERLYGRDLQHALADGWRPTVEQAVQLIRRVAEALAYAHARGVVHCDIKPANIYLQRRDKPKVLDFGIARILHGISLPALEGAVTGSPRYRAPEQLQKAPVDARTDLFSLGVVLYELLAGRRAFEGETLADINHAVLETDPTPVHEIDARIPIEVSAIVSRLMARAPSDRYTCASELSVDLRRWIQDQPSAQPMTQGPRRALRIPPAATTTKSRLPWGPSWLWAGGASLAAAALVVAWWGPRGAAVPVPASAPLAAEVLPTTPAVNGLSGVAATAEASTAVGGAPSTAEPINQPFTKPFTEPTPVPTPETARNIAPSAPAAPAPALTGSALTLEAVADSARAELQNPGVAATSPGSAGTARPVPRTRPRTANVPSRSGVTTDTATRSTVVTPAVAAESAAAPLARGTLQLAVTPWGQVEVDGAAKGTTPPLTQLTLPVGSHTITVRNSDFPPLTVKVEVGADKPVVLRHRFGS
jgi:eukaryotic-like serine/threonine-protein kinase